MKALSTDQPHASLCVTRQPWQFGNSEQCRYLASQLPDPSGAMVKRIETRSWPCPPALIGQPLAIHATKRVDSAWMATHDPLLHTFGWCFADDVRLPLGAVVGSGRVAACLPIVDDMDDALRHGPAIQNEDNEVLTVIKPGHDEFMLDISDQLPYGDFTPGRFAWLIEDAAPTTERCPWCWGEGRVGPDEEYAGGRVKPSFEMRLCPVCDGAGRCEPIPWASSGGRLPEWTPS